MLKYVESLQQQSQYEEQHLLDLREIYELAHQQGIDPQPWIEQLGFGNLGVQMQQSRSQLMEEEHLRQ